MLRKMAVLVWIVLITLGSAYIFAPKVVRAESPNAWTLYSVRLRRGPQIGDNVLATLPVDTPLVIEARGQDRAWVLAHTMDRAARGWLGASLLKMPADLSVYNLPISSEIINVNVTVDSRPTSAPNLASNAQTSGAENHSDARLPAYMNTPILPKVDLAMRAVARQIRARAQVVGNNPSSFAKIGDCMTAYEYFLGAVGNGHYDLGRYAYLQDVIAQFSAPLRSSGYNSFNIDSLATYTGMTSVGVQEPGWAIKGENLCSSQESMLDCEFRVDKPSVVLIMVGFADTQLISPTDFAPALRRLVQKSIAAGVIAVLSTFPDNEARKEESQLMNMAIVNIAREQHVPLINLDAALIKLPDHGVDKDSHLTVPPTMDQSASFTPENLRYGITLRNLLTLQALDIVWRELMK